MKINKKTKITAVVITAVVIGGIFLIFFSGNKYNDMGIINPSGKTIAQIADERGITVAELKEKYDLPKDMRSDTEEAAAYYFIPTEKMAQISGSTFEEFKALFGWSDEIKPDTPWGEAQDETQLKYMYQSEKALESFRRQYGLGEEITGETKYKEVRDKVSAENPDLAKLR